MKTVWENRHGELLRQRAFLVPDSFHGHPTDCVRERLAGGWTGRIWLSSTVVRRESLDVSVSRLFKAQFRRCYFQSMTLGAHEVTPTGRLKRTSLHQVCRWILNTWRSVSFHSIAKNLRVTVISNIVDDTLQLDVTTTARVISRAGEGKTMPRIEQMFRLSYSHGVRVVSRCIVLRNGSDKAAFVARDGEPSLCKGWTPPGYRRKNACLTGEWVREPHEPRFMLLLICGFQLPFTASPWGQEFCFVFLHIAITHDHYLLPAVKVRQLLTRTLHLKRCGTICTV